MKKPFAQSALTLLFQIVSMAFVYFAFGRLGLILDNPSGYVSPIWPASGVALAAVLLIGYRVWPGVLIGSFLTNLPVASGIFSFSPDIQSFLIPISIGIGATLQALAGAFLLRRYIDLSSGLIHAKEIILFYLFSGLLSCVISALWGVNTLYLSGVITGGDYLFSLLTWWVGDTIGVLIIVPLILSFVAKPVAIWKSRRNSVGFPMLLLLGLIVALYTFNIQKENERMEREFQQQAALMSDTIEMNLHKNIEVLYSVRNMFFLLDTIDQATFKTFLHDTLLRNFSIQAISWNPVVRSEARAAYVQAMRSEGYPDFIIKEGHKGSIVEAKTRDKYVVVTYIEPYKGNENVIGYDVYSNEARRAALDLACRSAKLTATDPLTLVQEESNQSGVLFFLPLYETVQTPLDAGEREDRLKGYVTGVYRTGDLVIESLKQFALRNVMLTLTDQTAPSGASALAAYMYDKNGSTVPVEDQTALNKQTLRISNTIDIGQKSWVFTLYALPEYLAEHRSVFSWAVLMASLLFATLLQLFLLLLSGRSILFHNMANELSAEVKRSKALEEDLIEANEALEQRVEERTQELHRAMQEALEANEAEQQASRIKGEFLANMSHEIRTPLNAIIGFIGLLKERTEDQKSIEYLRIIDSSSTSLLNTIEHILDFSKIGSGKLQLDIIDFHAKTEFDAVVHLFDAACTEKKITLQYTPSDTLPTYLRSDIYRLKQVISNLLSNAVKFTGSYRSITVCIDYKEGFLHVSVKDEGKGIAKEKQEQIFSAFGQEDGSTTRQYGGTGLGLTISAELVKLLGGELKLESTLGSESEFYFVIPVEIGAPVDLKTQSSEPVSLSGTVLLVEDNAINRLYVQIILDDLGLTYDVANDGLEALAQFERNTYDVILMDENMPNMGGIEATGKILALERQRAQKHTPIIALTANAVSGDRERFLAAGMDEYLSKPIDRNHLIALLNSVVGRQKR